MLMFFTMFLTGLYIFRVGQKAGPFLRVDNFAMVSGRKVCYTLKVFKLCLEKSVELHVNHFKYSCSNLHKYLSSLKLFWIWQQRLDFTEVSLNILNIQCNNIKALQQRLLHAWFVQMKFKKGTLDLDDHHQSLVVDRSLDLINMFWLSLAQQLINTHSIYRVSQNKTPHHENRHICVTP